MVEEVERVGIADRYLEALREAAVEVYHYENGEVLHVEKIYDYLEHLPREFVTEWVSYSTETGEMVARLYSTPVGLIIEEEWQPRPPYKWEERHVYFLR